MGARPLRQYYDGVTIDIESDLAFAVEPWVRHRRRFVDELAALDDGQWKSATRCTTWDARGVIGHLVVVDQFWLATLGAARRGDTPTRFIEGFDPSTGTDGLIAPLLDLAPQALLEQFVAGTDAFVSAIGEFDGDDWSAVGEAPFGHLPAHVIMGHAHWDSWLHERDILEPLGLEPPIERDELLGATVYTFVVGGLQGGLLGDPAPVGVGPEQAIEASLRFADLPMALHVRIDEALHLSTTDGSGTLDAGSAVVLVESVAGRGVTLPPGMLPAALDTQLTNAAQIL